MIHTDCSSIASNFLYPILTIHKKQGVYNTYRFSLQCPHTFTDSDSFKLEIDTAALGAFLLFDNQCLRLYQEYALLPYLL
jgi:hypothetical protein